MPSPIRSPRTLNRLPSLISRRMQMRMVALCVALAAVAVASGANALLQQAQNSRVVLDIPEGFQPAPLFSGFVNERLGVSYVILEAPREAYDEIVSGFTPEELAKRGITEPERGLLSRAGEHVYLRARQVSPTGTYSKFFLVFRTEDQSVLISANVPVDALRERKVTAAEIERILASARTVPHSATRELYRVGYLGEFKEAGTLVGTSKVYTRDGRIGPVREGRPRAVFMVAPSLDARPINEPRDSATRLLTSLTGYRDIKFEQPAEISIGGHAAILIEARATDGETGVPVEILQVLLLAPEGGYYRLLGIAPRSEAMLSEFRQIAESVELAAPGEADRAAK